LKGHSATVQLDADRIDIPSNRGVAAWSNGVVPAGFKETAM